MTRSDHGGDGRYRNRSRSRSRSRSPPPYRRYPQQNRRHSSRSPPYRDGDGDRYRRGYRQHRHHRPRPPRRRSPSPPRSPELSAIERDARTVICTQLAQRCRAPDLGQFLQDKAGPVRRCRIITDRYTGRSKGIAYVEFFDAESVPRAVDLSGELLLGAPLSVSVTEAEKNRQAAEKERLARKLACQIICVNLPPELDQEMLRQLFESFGAIRSATITRAPEGAPDNTPSVGKVEYEVPGDAKTALDAMDGHEVLNHNIGVAPAAAVSEPAVAPAAANTPLTSSFTNFGGGGGGGGVPLHLGMPPLPGGPPPGTSAVMPIMQLAPGIPPQPMPPLPAPGTAPMFIPLVPPSLTVAAVANGGGGAAGGSVVGGAVANGNGAPQIVATVAPPPPPATGGPAGGGNGGGPSISMQERADRTGISMTAASRAALMAKLAASHNADDLTKVADQAQVPLQAPSHAGVSTEPQFYLVIRNMFDASTETEPEWDLDLRDEVVEECSRYGSILHVFVDKASPDGCVYLKYLELVGAEACKAKMDGRYFAQKRLSADYVTPMTYEKRFPDAASASAILSVEH